VLRCPVDALNTAVPWTICFKPCLVLPKLLTGALPMQAHKPHERSCALPHVLPPALFRSRHPAGTDIPALSFMCTRTRSFMCPVRSTLCLDGPTDGQDCMPYTVTCSHTYRYVCRKMPASRCCAPQTVSACSVASCCGARHLPMLHICTNLVAATADSGRILFAFTLCGP
jgi:hypothetical protein